MLSKKLLPWVGSKKSNETVICEHIIANTVGKFNFIEPYAGGLSIFFALAERGVLLNRVINDTNPALINFYQCLRDDVEIFISFLAGLPKTSADYYELRRELNDWLGSPVMGNYRIAVVFAWLNSLSFCNLYRVNKAGMFNTPVRRDRSEPSLPSHDEYRYYASLLCGAEIYNTNAIDVIDAFPDYVVYSDPPYEATFDAYVKGGFRDASRTALYGTTAERRVPAFISDSGESQRLGESHGLLPIHVFLNKKGVKHSLLREILWKNPV